MKRKLGNLLFPFVVGIITGVGGVFLYELFGKPVLPTDPPFTWDEWHREWNKMLDLRDKQKAALEKTQPRRVSGCG